TTQLLEMGVKVVIALNMMDEAKMKKIEINLDNLSKNLGVPVVATVAAKRKGISELIEKAVTAIDEDYPKANKISYGEDIDKEIHLLKSLLEDSTLEYPSNWIAIKALEGDEEILKQISDKADIKERLV